MGQARREFLSCCQSSVRNAAAQPPSRHVSDVTSSWLPELAANCDHSGYSCSPWTWIISTVVRHHLRQGDRNTFTVVLLFNSRFDVDERNQNDKRSLSFRRLNISKRSFVPSCSLLFFSLFLGPEYFHYLSAQPQSGFDQFAQMIQPWASLKHL